MMRLMDVKRDYSFLINQRSNKVENKDEHKLILCMKP